MSERPGVTRVKIDHECFIPTAKHRIVTALSAGIDDPEERRLFGDFCQIIESLYHFQYHRTQNELKEDYIYFDTATGKQERANSTPDEIEQSENRFLENFMKVMERGNFRPLTQKDIDLADQEAYLFTLPVTVDWEKLDAELLTRFFQEHPYPSQGGEPPEFASRILIFQRGVGVDQSTGLHLIQKVDHLVTRLITKLLAPVRPLGRMVGLGKNPSDDVASLVQNGSRASDLSPAALHLGGAASGNGEPAEEDDGEKSHVFEDRYVERIPLHATGVGLTWLFKKTTIQEPTFQELIMLFRPATLPKQRKKDPEPEKNRAIVIKAFRDIPMADLEVVFPEKKVSMKLVDLVKLVITGTIGVVMVTVKFIVSAAVNPVVAASMLAAMAGYAGKVFMGFKVSKDRYQHVVTNSLYHKNLDNDLGVIFYLMDSLEEQEFKEAVLAYYFLWRRGDMEEETLDGICENFIKDNFGIEVDFEVDDAVDKLIKEGLVEEREGKYCAVSLEDALEKLDYKWDNFFQYNLA